MTLKLRPVVNFSSLAISSSEWLSGFSMIRGGACGCRFQRDLHMGVAWSAYEHDCRFEFFQGFAEGAERWVVGQRIIDG